MRATVTISSTPPDTVSSAPQADSVAPTTRRAWFGGRELDCAVHRWSALAAGSRVCGPAFIESDQTTVVVDEGSVATIDDLGNVHLEPLEAQR